MSLSGAQLLTRELRAEGVDTIFTVAGDHILLLLDVLDDEGFRLIDCRHEQAAVHMADAWGRITGRLGVTCFTTPGHANALPGLINALSTESPVLNIAGSSDLKNYHRGIMQEIDQVGIAKTVTKGAWLVHDAKRIPDMLQLAVRTAFDGRRGPVHLTIPTDVQGQIVNEEEIRANDPTKTRPRAWRTGVSGEIVAAVEILQAASAPLIVASTPAAYGPWSDEIASFIETTKIPLMTEEAARGIVSDDHPYCFGFFDMSQHTAANLIKECDAVLFLGKMLDFTIGYGFAPIIPSNARVIQVEPEPLQIGRNRSVDVGIVGDVGPVVEQMTSFARALEWRETAWLDRFRDANIAQLKRLDGLAQGMEPMSSMDVHKQLRSLLREDDILVFDGGDYAYYGRATLPARSPNSWYYLPNLGMLGQALPVSIAAKIAKPTSRVFCITGDGAFGFNAMEMDTAVRHQIPVIVLLGNDAAWGIDKNIQVGLYGKPVITDLAPSRYDILAQGLGAYGELVTKSEDLIPAIERAIASEQPSLLNIMVHSMISPRAQALVDSRKSGGAF